MKNHLKTTTTLYERFPEAESDLRDRVTRAVEQMITPLTTVVPIAALCSPVGDGYRVHISSKWLPGQSFEATLSEPSLRNLDNEWQKLCESITEAFAKGPLKIS